MIKSVSSTIIGLSILITCETRTRWCEDPLDLKEPSKKIEELNDTLNRIPDIGGETTKRIVKVFREETLWTAAVAASVGLTGYYVYHWAFPSPEKRARQAARGLVDCFKNNINEPRSKHGIPRVCVEQAVAYGRAREVLADSDRWPRTQTFINDFKQYAPKD